MRMQDEHKEWVDANFPGQPPELPAAGMVEEAGELLHALIAEYRLERWGADQRYSMERVQSDIFDAIGDCAIYTCSFCNANGWRFDWLHMQPRDFTCTKDKLKAGVRLVAIAARFFASRDREAAKEYLAVLKCIAELCKMDYDACVDTTWSKVKERVR